MCYPHYYEAVINGQAKLTSKLSKIPFLEKFCAGETDYPHYYEAFKQGHFELTSDLDKMAHMETFCAGKAAYLHYYEAVVKGHLALSFDTDKIRLREKFCAGKDAYPHYYDAVINKQDALTFKIDHWRHFENVWIKKQEKITKVLAGYDAILGNYVGYRKLGIKCYFIPREKIPEIAGKFIEQINSDEEYLDLFIDAKQGGRLDIISDIIRQSLKEKATREMIGGEDLSSSECSSESGPSTLKFEATESRSISSRDCGMLNDIQGMLFRTEEMVQEFKRLKKQADSKVF